MIPRPARSRRNGRASAVPRSRRRRRVTSPLLRLRDVEFRMLHALIYLGSYELNFDGLAPGATTYTSTGGGARPIESPPGNVDGVVVGYMERSGKKFTAVRVRFEDH